MRHQISEMWVRLGLQDYMETRFNNSVFKLELEIFVTSHGINNIRQCENLLSTRKMIIDQNKCFWLKPGALQYLQTEKIG